LPKIVQSDHGIRTTSDRTLDIPRDEWRKVFGAYYLPGVDYTTLDDAMPPEDSFRLVLDEYFGLEYKRLGG
jgi:hypothetical protein